MADAAAKLRVVGGNPSGIFPTEFKVVVRPIDVGEKTKGGIFLPEDTRERDKFAVQEGELIAVSPVAFTYEKWPEGSGPPKVGDRVLFARYAGTTRKGKDGLDYRIVNDRDIAAVLA